MRFRLRVGGGESVRQGAPFGQRDGHGSIFDGVATGRYCRCKAEAILG